jgi:hypothetical protein
MLMRFLMNIFNFACCEDDLKAVELLLKKGNDLAEETNDLLRVQVHILRRIEECLCKPKTPHTASIVVVFSGDNHMAAITGSVAVGATLTGTIVPLEADGVTVTPGAVVSGQSWSVDSNQFVSFVQNPDGTATFTGVAAGTATVTASATVVDQDGTTSNFSATNTITVTGGTATGRTAGIQINFS